MSRIGNIPISIPKEVSVIIKDGKAVVRGPKGELSYHLPAKIKVNREEDSLKITRADESKSTRSLHGLSRSLLANMITGVKQGYQKQLELVGTGYRVSKEENKLTMTLGFSHPVTITAPEGITFEVEGNNKITVSGIDKQKVGQIAAEIRSLRKPEPYKGKGIRYQGEAIRRKAGKAAKVGAAGE